MIFTETNLKGAYIIELEKFEDSRGFFARAWDKKVFNEHGLIGDVKQQNTSFTVHKGTIRGMHYQVAPHQETKLISCLRGAIYDVIIDLRPDSPTYMQWLGVELSVGNYKMIYVPKDFAHGFQTLEDNSLASYLVTEVYTPHAEAGIRYNDPSINIEWPLPVSFTSDKDANWPDFKR